MTAADSFLLALLLVFLLPQLVRAGAHTDRWAPLAVVQIGAGIVLGPGVFGAIAPRLHALVFPAPAVALLNGLAAWGVMLFVAIAGIELDLAGAWARRREASVTAALALGLPLLLGGAPALLLAGPAWMGVHAVPWQFAAATGMACAVTALPILVLLLDELGMLRTEQGQRILSFASLDDVAIWTVLALVLLDRARLWHQLMFLAALPAGAVLVRALIRRLPPAARWVPAMCWVLACALAADLAGLHYMAGAFLAGVALPAAWFPAAGLDAARGVVLQALMPVFFLVTGLKTGWHAGGIAVLGAAALLLAAAVGGKLAGTAIAGRLFAWPAGEALQMGWLLQTKALIMIIFATVLLDRAIITPAMFTALLLMALASTALTMPVVRHLRRC